MSEAIIQGLEDADLEVTRLVQMVTRMISYTSVLPAPDEDGNVPDKVMDVSTFIAVRGLAVLDFMSGMPAKDRAKAVGLTPQKATALRRTEEYGIVLGLVKQRLHEIASTGSMTNAAKVFEPVMVAESLEEALLGQGGGKAQAVASFVDRGSAKKGREGETGAVGSHGLSEALLQLMNQTLAQMQSLGPAAPKDITPARGDVMQLTDGGTYDGSVETEAKESE